MSGRSVPTTSAPAAMWGSFPLTGNSTLSIPGFSPGARRMQALVGPQSSFDRGRQELQLLACIELTTKAGERTA
jgi:hypothetical protein